MSSASSNEQSPSSAFGVSGPGPGPEPGPASIDLSWVVSTVALLPRCEAGFFVVVVGFGDAGLTFSFSTARFSLDDAGAVFKSDTVACAVAVENDEVEVEATG